MKDDAHQIALEIWNDVLEHMPSDLQHKFALVEARKRPIGMPNGDAINAALEALAVNAFGTDQVSDPVGDASMSSAPSKGDKADIKELITSAVQDGFAAFNLDDVKFNALRLAKQESQIRQAWAHSTETDFFTRFCSRNNICKRVPTFV